jgi:rubrerythrin
MSIYTNPNWRAIYKKHYGAIPKEPDGRSYEIHHIDGNRANNDISNLIALTTQQHYDIHFLQGDWAACARIGWRLNLSFEEISYLRSQAAKEQVANGTHNFLGGEIQGRTSRRRVAEGTHPWVNKQTHVDRNKKLLEEGRHYLKSDEYKKIAKERQLERSANGTHPFKNPEIRKQISAKRRAKGNLPSQMAWVCPHCKKEGYHATNYARWHGDKCKLAPTNQD